MAYNCNTSEQLTKSREVSLRQLAAPQTAKWLWTVCSTSGRYPSLLHDSCTDPLVCQQLGDACGMYGSHSEKSKRHAVWVEKIGKKKALAIDFFILFQFSIFIFNVLYTHLPSPKSQYHWPQVGPEWCWLFGLVKCVFTQSEGAYLRPRPMWPTWGQGLRGLPEAKA